MHQGLPALSRYISCPGCCQQVPHGGYGDDQSLRFLIMTRLGPDVEAARTESGPWHIVRHAGYARQMLALLRFLHEHCKMVFVDVKPGEPCSLPQMLLVLISPPVDAYAATASISGLGCDKQAIRFLRRCLQENLGEVASKCPHTNSRRIT